MARELGQRSARTAVVLGLVLGLGLGPMLGCGPAQPDDSQARLQGAGSGGPPTVSVGIGGSGLGRVSSAPGGITCVTGSGTGCSATFTGDSSVTLAATAASGSRFVGWGGACTGAAGCTFTVTADAAVTATFSRIQYPLTVVVGAGGAVTASAAGLDCPATRCDAVLDPGTEVTLTAQPVAGLSLLAWAAPAAAPHRRAR